MTLTDIQSLISSLTNDPTHTRYQLSDINTELDNTMNDWNIKAKIIKGTTTETVAVNTRQYLLSLLTGTPIEITRVTHKGLDLKKRSKAYFDLYNTDWTQDIGTPLEFCVEATDPSNLYLTVHPTPQSGDIGANLVVEAIIGHTPMSASTDVPFMLGAVSNYLLRPYDWGICYTTASRLLARDPTPENSKNQADYGKIGTNVLADVIQVFKAFEAEVPKRMSGGRNWNSGNVRFLK